MTRAEEMIIRARKDRSETAMSVGATIRRWGLRVVEAIAGAPETAEQTETEAWDAFARDVRDAHQGQSKQHPATPAQQTSVRTVMHGERDSHSGGKAHTSPVAQDL
jgi:hypothetical protein